MKFVSFTFIYRNMMATFKRFPLAIVAAFIATLSSIWLIELDNLGVKPNKLIQKIILISILGISLFTATVVTVERWKSDLRTLLTGQITGLLLLTAYIFLLPDDLFEAPEKHVVRYALFLIGSHLLVAVAPFYRKDEINGFWQYNKALFLRFLTAVLYANVLFAGLAVALLSIDALLGVEIESMRYAQLWILVFIIFNTWFFLAGVPENLNVLDQKTDYPSGLKFFAQYVLIPLISIYVIILYLYAGKIVLSWSWPEGWVANLILGFSILGILSLLLLYPYRNKAENKWMRKFSKDYYLVLVPLVVMLLLAIWRRVSEYGFTENRYFVLVAGIWLGGIALYFIFGKSKNIKVIPASLVVIVILISFGPWGAISVSESSQIQRLESALTDNNILADGQINPPEHSIPVEETKEISTGVLYLAEVHGLDGIQPWFKQDLDSLSDSSKSVSRFALAQDVVKMMGLDYVNSVGTSYLEYRYFTSESKRSIRLNNFDWLVKDQQFNSLRDTSRIHIDAHDLIFQVERDSMLFGIRNMDNEIPVITVDLTSKINTLLNEFSGQRSTAIPMEEMIIEKENESARVQLLLKNINTRKIQTRWRLESLNTDVLLTFKVN